MKLLITTQIVDQNDSNLGFFHKWIEEIAKNVDKLTVVCLFAGEYDLPDNVTVLSLGKEKKISRLQYLCRFYKYIFSECKNYDHVFVHMNPEYVVLGGIFWRLWRKKILFWYTHKAVNLKLRLAEKLATKIFTASKESFRLPSKKLEIVGHGIDVDFFTSSGVSSDNTISLLSVGRISPIKDLETVILACNELIKKNPERKIRLNIVGEPITTIDFEYKKILEELIEKLRLSQYVKFVGSRTYKQMACEYHQNNILIHSSKTGSVDKVVLEALAAGLVVFSSSEAYNMFENFIKRFPQNDFGTLADSLEKMFQVGIIGHNQKAIAFVGEHFSLNTAIDKIVGYF